MKTFSKIAIAYGLSLLFALWSALCVCAGAAWMLVAVKAMLRHKGLL